WRGWRATPNCGGGWGRRTGGGSRRSSAWTSARRRGSICSVSWPAGAARPEGVRRMSNLRRSFGRSGLLLVPLLVGTLLSWDKYTRTVCLTEDGVIFLTYARQLASEGPP